jgi:hypothetical protein
MTLASEREALADEVEASLREAQEVLKVAETGTLEQRMFACSNSTPIVEEAARKLAAYKAQGARADRVQSLAIDLDRLTAAQQEASRRCQVDAGEAWSRVQFESTVVQGANANGQTLVVLDETAAITRPDGGGGGGRGRAAWRFNYGAAAGEGGKDDLAQLKGRLERELTIREAVDRSKQVDVGAEAQARAKSPPAQQAAQDPATQAYDMSRNSLVLNEELRRVQTEGRQLGTSAAPVDDLRERLEQTLERRVGDEERAGEDGTGATFLGAHGRVDVVRGRLPAGDVVLRTGLMGIDVPLPRDGRTFWFVGVRTGSPVALEASEPGTPTWLRVLFAAGLWSALAAGLLLLHRTLGVR